MATFNPTDYVDLDERRRAALNEIDNAKFGWFHIRACIVSGIGFFTDSYDLFAINLVSAMLGFVYFSSNKNTTPPNVDTAIKVAASVGTMVGQVLFGWLADRVGRKRMYGIELIIIIVATLGSSLAANSVATSVWGVIVFWRVILGIGIGGDYPLSAIITSEFATTKRRGAMMAAVFAMQGFGQLAASLVSLIALVGYQNQIIADPTNADFVWRIVIGLGAIPACLALYYRLTIPETPRYTMDIEQKITKGAKDATAFLSSGAPAGNYDDTDLVERTEVQKASFADFMAYFGQWKNGKVLFGTAVSWFVLDVAVYGIGLNNTFILSAIGFTSTQPYDSLFKAAAGNAVIACLGTIPGYWVSVFTIETLGRKNIQLGGFFALGVLYVILGFAFDQIKGVVNGGIPVLFIVIFTLSQFFQNFGPNTTTFIVPGEVFPTRYRSTGHGISAASGKFGAIVAQIAFGYMKNIGGPNAFVGKLIGILGIVMFIGLGVSLFIPETKGLSLEELSNEDQNNFVHTKNAQKQDQ
jgi:PHS family inorganic phosphate transporter-like MFS transporter